jgi:predicted deacylase
MARTTAEHTKEHRSPRRVRRSAPKKQAAAPDLAMKRLIDTRIERRFRTLQSEIAQLRADFEASEIALAAAELRATNERRSHAGLAQLRDVLNALRERGIVDADGKRVRQELPAEMEGSADVV